MHLEFTPSLYLLYALCTKSKERTHTGEVVPVRLCVHSLFLLLLNIILLNLILGINLFGWNLILERTRKIFSTSFRPALGSTQSPIQWVPGALSPGVKRPGREADHSPLASAEVKKI
jgi:hypothetical protein